MSKRQPNKRRDTVPKRGDFVRAWDRVIDAWGDEADRLDAWRNADASLIPDFVPRSYGTRGKKHRKEIRSETKSKPNKRP